MSVKCDYSAKYKPLVLAKRSQLNEDAFRAWVSETFANPEFAISVTNASSQFLSDLDLDKRTINTAPNQIDSIKSYFVNNSSGYNNCIKEFSNTVVEASLYNLDENRWVDAEGITGRDNITNLNKNLFNYKIELVNRIFRNFHRAEISLDVTSTDAGARLTGYIQEALSLIDTATQTDPVAYAAYVILKNFNKLIEEKTPFIEVRKEYLDTNTHGVNMYLYKGPSVKHRVSWTTNEHISAESQYSDLAKALLNYFPEKSPITAEIIKEYIDYCKFFINNLLNKKNTDILTKDEIDIIRKETYEKFINNEENFVKS